MKLKNLSAQLPRALSLLSFIFFACFPAAQAQTTEFTYQGKLSDSGVAANVNHDFEFRLCDSASECSSPIAIQQRLNVPVSNGMFTVNLDFGASAFPGADRFLEIAVRPAGSGGFQQLLPRQPIKSAPYSIQALNATTAETATTADNSLKLGGAAANQFVQTNDARLSDARTPLPGSDNYVRNTTTQQTGANFNIGGTGEANVLNATQQFSLNNQRILSNAGTENLFAGVGAGAGNTTGGDNSFFGFNAGRDNTTGTSNSFFGSAAGIINTTGSYNTFLGSLAGGTNSQSGSNTFIGSESGFALRLPSSLHGYGNTLLGAFTKIDTGDATPLTNATAIGFNATVTRSNSLVLGATSGIGNGTSVNVGIGTTAPLARLDVRGNVFVGLFTNPQTPADNAVFFSNDHGWLENTFRIDAANNFLYIVGRSNTGSGAGTGIIFRTAPAGGGESDRVSINPDGTLSLNFLGDSGTTSLCRNVSSGRISFCSSSRRYKTNIKSFTDGLNLINKFNPVSFDWKTNNQPDIGLIAEEVAEIEPRLAYKNQNGEIEGVSYSQVGVVLINAVKEQQTQIEQLQEQNKQLQVQVEILKKLICQSSSQAGLCKQREEEK